MIETTDEFIVCIYSDDPEERRRSRFGPLAEHIWDDVIANHPDHLESLVWNKTVPVIVLERLATWPDERIRFWVAMKRKLSLEAMEVLSQDASSSVRLRLAMNPKTADTVLRRLSKDPDPVVAEEALQRLEARGQQNESS